MRNNYNRNASEQAESIKFDEPTKVFSPDTRKKLLDIVRGKDVFLATHWDCDGVTSGALLYHLIKNEAKNIRTLSKGDVFLISPQDITGEPEVIICSDIKPSKELLMMKNSPTVIPIDHHPSEEISLYPFTIYNTNIQSCSLLIWNELLQDTDDPYFIFLTILGYFGDGGAREDIPPGLWNKAKEIIPEMMTAKPSYYNSGSFLEIEKYVSSINIGKRMFWSGEIPFEMLKDIKHFKDFVTNAHPIAKEIQNFKSELRKLYNMNLNVQSLGGMDYAIIESDKNIQGVLCARYLKDKPIVVMNRINGKVIGSMRSPSSLDFDSGVFLTRYAHEFNTYHGGGHKEAAGFTLDENEFDKFFSMLKKDSHNI